MLVALTGRANCVGSSTAPPRAVPLRGQHADDQRRRDLDADGVFVKVAEGTPFQGLFGPAEKQIATSAPLVKVGAVSRPRYVPIPPIARYLISR